MNSIALELARELLGKLNEKDREELATDPVTTIARMGVEVQALAPNLDSDECSCDGAYFYKPHDLIAYSRTPGSRREKFTLLHELGHFLTRYDADVLSALADVDTYGGSQAAEERVCHAFAGLILVPDALVTSVLSGSRPEARHLKELFLRSEGSREACAVRLSEQMRCVGYIVLADPRKKSVRFAASSPEMFYTWRRGSSIKESHPIWRAGPGGRSHRGQGTVAYSTGEKAFWLDAVADGVVIYGVFAEEKYWDAPGLSLLDGTVTKARGYSFSGVCAHCGERTWGYRACEECGDPWCRRCRKCGCGAPPTTDRTCRVCQMVKAAIQFEDGGAICVDCR